MTDFFEDGYDIDEDDEDIIVLHNEETDMDEEYYLLAQYDLDGVWYVVLQPTKPLPDIEEDMVLIYELVEKDGEYSFKVIDDDDRLQRAFDEFNRLRMEYDDCDCDECGDGCDCENCAHEHHDDEDK